MANKKRRLTPLVIREMHINIKTTISTLHLVGWLLLNKKKKENDFLQG